MGEAITLLWGAPDMRDAIGIVQGCGVNTSQENAEAKDEQGKTIEMRSFSRTTELSVEALVTSDKTPPKAGEKVTVSEANGELAGDYLCTSSNVMRSNSDYQKVSVTLQRKDSAAIVPSVTPAGA